VSALAEGLFEGDLAVKGERLALVTFATGARCQRAGEVHYLDMAGGDLTRLNSSRAPLLLEHRPWIDALLGNVVEAWAENGEAYAVVRFAETQLAAEIWQLIGSGFPIAASLGYSIGQTRPGDLKGEPGAFIIDTWAANEISACVTGADAGAHFVQRSLAEIAELREERRARRLAQERAEKLAAVKGDRWRAWAANGAAEFIGAAAGVSARKLSGPLATAVERHLAELEGEI
jgi:hypothetical protein